MLLSSRPAMDLLARGASWLTGSGIQEAHGGVARYRRADLGRTARVSTEITGYAVSTFVWLYNECGEREYLEAARRAARFLMEQAWDGENEIYPFEYGEGAEPLAYFFDSGIIARGLLALWRATGEAQWLEGARAAGLSMIRDFAADEGASHPILRLPSKEPQAYEPRWSRRQGCYQLKSALAWHELAAVDGDGDFARAYARAVERAMATHASFLPDADPERTVDRLHAYCYFLEGLLPAGEESVLRAGIVTATGYLRELAPRFERSDVYAQLLRLRLWAGMLDGAGELAEAIPGFAAPNGAFWFGRKRGEVLPFENPVSTAFCLQAWEMWRQHCSGRLGIAPPALI